MYNIIFFVLSITTSFGCTDIPFDKTSQVLSEFTSTNFCVLARFLCWRCRFSLPFQHPLPVLWIRLVNGFFDWHSRGFMCEGGDLRSVVVSINILYRHHPPRDVPVFGIITYPNSQICQLSKSNPHHAFYIPRVSSLWHLFSH